MPEHRVHGVSPHAVPLRFQVGGEAVDAETPGSIAQAVAYEPAQRRHLRDSESLHHVAEHHRVHVTLEQLDPERGREPLDLWETTLREELAEPLLDARTLGGRPPP